MLDPDRVHWRLVMESQCEYCGYTDKQRCRSVPEARTCSRTKTADARALLDREPPEPRPRRKMVQRHVETTWDWCQYMDDEELGLWTVRKTVKTDFCKFHSKGEALAFIEEKKNGKS